MPFPKVKTFLGSGRDKVCYSIPGNKVALIADDDTINREIKMLRRLRKAGVPVLSARVGRVLDEDGEITRALIAPKFDYHTFGFQNCRLNAKHKKNIKKIYQAIKRHRLNLSDLQFLGKRTGEVVVCDPGCVSTMRKDEYNDTLGYIQEILNKRTWRYQ